MHSSLGYSNIFFFVASCLKEVCSCAISHTGGRFAESDDETMDSTGSKFYPNSSFTPATKTCTQVCLYFSAGF
jgi:hypothetical protein